MVSHSLPVNVYSYKATIFGFYIRDLLILSALLCSSILVLRINPLMTVLLLISSFLILYFNRFGKNSKILRVLAQSVALPGKHRTIEFPLKFEHYNSHLLFSFENNFSIFCEVIAPDILMMREETQSEIYRGIQSALDHTAGDCTFYSLHNKTEYPHTGHLAFRSFIRFSASITRPEGHSTYLSIITSFDRFLNEVQPYGVKLREITGEEELSELIDSLGP